VFILVCRNVIDLVHKRVGGGIRVASSVSPRWEGIKTGLQAG
jgi:hypothetical protein